MEQSKNNKKKKQAQPVRVQFLVGSPVDSNTPRGALGVLGGLAGCAVAFLLIGAVLTFDADWLRILLNAMVLIVAYSLFYSAGMSAGTGDVNHGEIMFRREQTGREVSPAERSRCYHPMKGFVTGMLGSLPLFLLALLFALIAKRQVYTMGVLPSWISGIQGRGDITSALVAYTQPTPLGLEGVLRVIFRLCLMPWVNMVGSTNGEGLLLLERLSPLLMLIPGVCFGVGYRQGIAQRSKIHTDIAQNRRKQAKKARREKARREAAAQPERLN